ncbi:hypothetical protein AOLI_G00200960 [Acnodon oligacanthus]
MVLRRITGCAVVASAFDRQGLECATVEDGGWLALVGTATALGTASGHDRQRPPATSLLPSNPIELWPASLCIQSPNKEEKDPPPPILQERERERTIKTLHMCNHNMSA